MPRKQKHVKYETPRLHTYGTLQQLTKGTTTGSPDFAATERESN